MKRVLGFQPGIDDIAMQSALPLQRGLPLASWGMRNVPCGVRLLPLTPCAVAGGAV